MRLTIDNIDNHKGPRLFITADTHFGHTNIIKFCSRPFFDVEEMDRILIQNWNSVVGKDDIIIHLGDFAFAKKEKIIALLAGLNGNKRLIMGNHDWRSIGAGDNNMPRNPSFYREVGFDEVYDQPILFAHYILSHEPVDIVSPASCFGNIYGHVHDDERYFTITKSTACMSVERWNYTPILFIDIIKAMQKAAAEPQKSFPEKGMLFR